MDETVFDELAIRDFREADFPSLARLWSESGVANPARGDSLESIRETLGSGGRVLVIGREEVLASVWLTDDGRRLYLHHMAVLPAWQRRGLGSRLMEASLRIARERSRQIKLEVHRTNLGAAALYRRYGFESLGDYKVMILRDLG